jgi:hypothetical protein
VGQAIEEFHADRLEEHHETLAYHYQNSAHTEKAIHYLELAGDYLNRATGLFNEMNMTWWLERARKLGESLSLN